ncbi:MAG: RNB domain-containing ribonuclease [Planctomycetaceae bacterium]|nr:RNB domain-containing ribonuclease [Planctomycetaceae bacterium]
MPPLEESIVQLVNAPGYRPVKPRVITKQLKLPQDQAIDVRRAVKRLVRDGRLAYGSNHLVMPLAPSAASGQSPLATSQQPNSPEESPKRVRRSPSAPSSKASGKRLVGVFQRTQKGFGFVRLRNDDAATELKDIYIPAESTKDAATGDVVLVQVGRHRPGQPGPRGEVVEVVERETQQFVGTYLESAGAAYVRIDGSLFARPIYVGDPGAKNAQPDDKVVIEMLRFPSALRDGEGVITEVLGPRGKPGVDTLSIIREFNLPDEFPADVLADAHAQAEKFDESLDGRTDFTDEIIVTIDPVDARDFDDAISLESLPDGGWRLGVHIADVSHFVRPGSPLDREATDRATSVYLPDRVLPMLPEVISNGLASLQPGKVRFTKSAIIEFTAEGLRTSTELHSAAIRSSKRLTYEQVDEFLNHIKPRPAIAPGGANPKDAAPSAAHTTEMRRKLGAKVFDLLKRMHTLAMILRKRRLANGALEVTMPEVKVELDKQGRVVGAHVVENTESHQIIEEFMLAANEAVAEKIRDRGWHFLRRVHQSPSPQKLQALTEFIAELGYKTGSLQSRFALQELLDAATGRPEQHAVHFAVLRSLQRAIYSPKDEGHYALASECYCHFTSPIRRYPDLTVHRLVSALLTKAKPRNDYDELVVLGRHCSDREQRAEAAERDLTKLKLLAYLSERIDEEMDAVITGVESYGIFVEGIELPAEGLIRVESLRDDTYHFDRAAHTLSGYREGNSFRLGDLLRVAVAKVDLERREIDFRLVKGGKSRPKGRPASPRKQRKQPRRR